MVFGLHDSLLEGLVRSIFFSVLWEFRLLLVYFLVLFSSGVVLLSSCSSCLAFFYCHLRLLFKVF